MKYIASTFFGLIAIIEPTFPFAAVLIFAIIIDCWSAYDLNLRLSKQHPERVVGKFQSRMALKIFKTFGQAYLIILLLHFVDVIILTNFNYLNLSNIGAAIFCAIQIWSILENLSSANGAQWAKMAQKIMIDKAHRHFDIKLTDFKDNDTNKDSSN
jgi:hypothetical protein